VAGYNRIAESELPVDVGREILSFRAFAYTNDVGDDEVLALVYGDPQRQSAPLVRPHSACLTGDALGSVRCDCGHQLRQSLSMIKHAKAGVLIYFNLHEGRGIGLLNKIRAYANQDEGQDTWDANVSLGLPVDAREYLGVGDILRDIGLSSVRLITNNPAKIHAISNQGIVILETVTIAGGMTRHNRPYLQTKARRMNHRFGELLNAD
jgi:3,4-dihydroxy 2-butanone 4-phosphate synthase / GTP cyclohydrolase II